MTDLLYLFLLIVPAGIAGGLIGGFIMARTMLKFFKEKK